MLFSDCTTKQFFNIDNDYSRRTSSISSVNKVLLMLGYHIISQNHKISSQPKEQIDVIFGTLFQYFSPFTLYSKTKMYQIQRHSNMERFSQSSESRTFNFNTKFSVVRVYDEAAQASFSVPFSQLVPLKVRHEPVRTSFNAFPQKPRTNQL